MVETSNLRNPVTDRLYRLDWAKVKQWSRNVVLWILKVVEGYKVYRESNRFLSLVLRFVHFILYR